MGHNPDCAIDNPLHDLFTLTFELFPAPLLLNQAY